MNISFDANPILPHLWQGSVPPRGDVLKRAGFDVLVLMANEEQPASSCFPGITVLHAPIDDSYTPTLKDMRIALSASRKVSRAIRRGAKVLVTCFMGKNRSGLVSALAYRDLMKCSGIDAVRAVQNKRGGALFNTAFVQIVSGLGDY